MLKRQRSQPLGSSVFVRLLDPPLHLLVLLDMLGGALRQLQLLPHHAELVSHVGVVGVDVVPLQGVVAGVCPGELSTELLQRFLPTIAPGHLERVASVERVQERGVQAVVAFLHKVQEESNHPGVAQ